MKKIFFIFYLITYTVIQAQVTCPTSVTAPCSNTPFNGNLNLVNTLYTYAVNSGISYARSASPALYGDVIYIGDDYTTCPQAGMDDCIHTAGNLVYDVYYPSNYLNKVTCALPAVILFHAGGFSECNNKDQIAITVICQELAMRGYVVFNVEYRDGTITTTDMAPGTMRPFTTVQQQLAAYRACQDARGAIRTIIQRAMDGFDSDKYRIDYTNIFIGGASGGAVAAMSAAWYTAPMVYAVFPAASSSPTIQLALGNINTNYYDAPATMDYQQYIKGTVSISGAIGIPLSYNSHEYDFFDPSLLKPHIGFHGKLDDVFPYPDGSNQKVYFAPPPPINSTDYNKETLCIGTSSYNLDNTDITGSIADQINGSGLNMRNILNHFTIANELYLDCDLYHDPYHNHVFTGNYGTTAANQTQAAKYIAQRIATFFQAVLSGRAGSIGTDYFPNCENFRYGCNAQTTACSGCQ